MTKSVKKVQFFILLCDAVYTVLRNKLPPVTWFYMSSEYKIAKCVHSTGKLISAADLKELAAYVVLGEHLSYSRRKSEVFLELCCSMYH